MPVLAPQPILWPEDLFLDGVESRDSLEWVALHVRPRAEKVVVRYLCNRRTPCFLPQIERSKRYQRRLVRSHLVLFPGYVFALHNGLHFDRLLVSKETIRVLRIDDQIRVDNELREIYRLIQSGFPLTREERLQPSSEAKIVRGPLAGLRGRVVKNQGGQKFVLLVQFLQQGVSVSVDSTSIEAL